MNKTFQFLLVLLLISVQGFCQIEMPAPSPLATFTSKVGLTDVTIEYSRPSKKGREIFGTLVPYDEMWRTGANASTKISFSDEVIINDQKIPGGKYALYTIPGREFWVVILHKNLTYWGTGGEDYKADEDEIRLKVSPKETGTPVETLTMSLGNNQMDQADFVLAWDNVMINFTIQSPVDEKVVTSIDKTLNPGGSAYYSAGRYYLESGKDYKLAKHYLETACQKYEKEERKPYWAYYRLALAQKELGDKKGAKASSEKSMAYAKEQGAKGYITMNEDLMKEL